MMRLLLLIAIVPLCYGSPVRTNSAREDKAVKNSLVTALEALVKRENQQSSHKNEQNVNARAQISAPNAKIQRHPGATDDQRSFKDRSSRYIDLLATSWASTNDWGSDFWSDNSFSDSSYEFESNYGWGGRRFDDWDDWPTKKKRIVQTPDFVEQIHTGSDTFKEITPKTMEIENKGQSEPKTKIISKRNNYSKKMKLQPLTRKTKDILEDAWEVGKDDDLYDDLAEPIRQESKVINKKSAEKTPDVLQKEVGRKLASNNAAVRADRDWTGSSWNGGYNRDEGWNTWEESWPEVDDDEERRSVSARRVHSPLLKRKTPTKRMMLEKKDSIDIRVNDLKRKDGLKTVKRRIPTKYSTVDKKATIAEKELQLLKRQQNHGYKGKVTKRDEKKSTQEKTKHYDPTHRERKLGNRKLDLNSRYIGIGIGSFGGGGGGGFGGGGGGDYGSHGFSDDDDDDNNYYYDEYSYYYDDTYYDDTYELKKKQTKRADEKGDVRRKIRSRGIKGDASKRDMDSRYIGIGIGSFGGGGGGGGGGGMGQYGSHGFSDDNDDDNQYYYDTYYYYDDTYYDEKKRGTVKGDKVLAKKLRNRREENPRKEKH